MLEKGNTVWKGRKHTAETRRKMSEAARRRWAGDKAQVKTAGNGFQMLMAAIVRQAIKDGAAWFFETETGKGYCAIAGINPANSIGGRA